MNLTSKFRGCLIGGLLGDCLGAPFEGENRISKSVLNSYFNRLLDPSLKVPYKSYTDDSAMTKCIAYSLVEKKEFHVADIAKRFVKEYYAEPNRGYGKNVVDVFAALRASGFKDVFAPAAVQFGGTGSYGNGAAMRIAPIALFTHSEPIPVVIDMAKQSAKVTHANRLGYNGAILQAVAIRDALLHKGENINPLTFVERLIACMRMVEKYTEEEIIDHNKKSEYIYCSALEKIKFLLEKGNDVTISDVVDSLGNEISAPGSVPTAIYVFLRAQKQIEAVETDNPFQRTIHYAVSLGGDTDTIAAMAGNIAGAFYGVEKIPEGFMHHCEGVEEMNKLAKELGNLDR
ncbi:UNVERIFIED_CONTAM: hypothetical protein RMT77_010313 [Armadillidium vulgare]